MQICTVCAFISVIELPRIPAYYPKCLEGVSYRISTVLFSKKCRRFYLSVFHTIDDAKEDSDKKIIAIQPEVCLTPFITGKLLRDAFNHDLPQSKVMIPMIEKIFLKNRERVEHGNFLIYFTEAGIKHFAETGLIEEFPDTFYHPFTPEQRLTLLKEIKFCCQHDYYRILKGSLQYLPANLHLCVRDTDCELT